jgi:hypothetical protein
MTFVGLQTAELATVNDKLQMAAAGAPQKSFRLNISRLGPSRIVLMEAAGQPSISPL